MTAHFVDSSVLLVASGAVHPQRTTCRSFVAAAARDGNRMHVSVETIQEVLFHRMRRGERGAAVGEVRALAESCVLHPFDVEVLHRSTDLIESTATRGRDAVIAATALTAGFTEIVSLDADFAVVPGLIVLTPAEALTRLTGHDS